MMCCVELNHLVRLLINPRLVSAPLSVDGPIASWILHRNDRSDVELWSKVGDGVDQEGGISWG